MLLFFFDKGYIQLSGKFIITVEEHIHEYDEVYPVKNDLGFLNLLTKLIIKVELNNDRTDLTIIFEDNTSLKLIGNEHYESYMIKVNDEKIIV